MIHIVTKWPISDLQMPKIKELKIFKVFVSIATNYLTVRDFTKIL